LFAQLVSKIFNLQVYVVLIHRRHRQTDGQTTLTTCNRMTALCTIVHRAVKTFDVLITRQFVRTVELCSTNDFCFFYLQNPDLQDRPTQTGKTVRDIHVE